MTANSTASKQVFNLDELHTLDDGLMLVDWCKQKGIEPQELIHETCYNFLFSHMDDNQTNKVWDDIQTESLTIGMFKRLLAAEKRTATKN